MSTTRYSMSGPAFKGYCWAVGTTSYRTDNFNLNIERQLEMMSRFRAQPENRGVSWVGNSAFQTAYYNYLKANGFVKGDAPRPDKDARQKTSGLKDIGLMDEDRNVTPAGQALLAVAREGDFTPDNLLELPRDSFIFLKQMLKASNEVDGKRVRPFVVFLCLVSKLGYLSYEEFTYLLPLCVDRETFSAIGEEIVRARREGGGIDRILLSVLMEKENYQEALKLFLEEPVTEELVCAVGMNRKSKAYDKPYYAIYQALRQAVLEGEPAAPIRLFQAVGRLTNPKVGAAWRKLLFETASEGAVKSRGLKAMRDSVFSSCRGEAELKEAFFKAMHRIKAKATLADYFDLNRRYFKVTDAVLFEDGRVELDILPRCFFTEIAGRLEELAFCSCPFLEEDTALEEIAPCLGMEAERLYHLLSQALGERVEDVSAARAVLKYKRSQRFLKMVEERFTPGALRELFRLFEQRRDGEIHRLVTDNADIPTIYEYVTAIAWYRISGLKGDVLEFMNLSLEADLLPRSHAAGGEADIVWKYEAGPGYPAHTLLIEATLSDGSGQRRMEMEPVSRHLGERLLSQGGPCFCVFTSTNLNYNVISDFRLRRDMVYYSQDGKRKVKGLDIFPLYTGQLSDLLERGIGYGSLYGLLMEAKEGEEEPKEWFERRIRQGIKALGRG